MYPCALYTIKYGLNKEQISTFYSINPSQVIPIIHGNKQDYLISSVPCSPAWISMALSRHTLHGSIERYIYKCFNSGVEVDEVVPEARITRAASLGVASLLQELKVKKKDRLDKIKEGRNGGAVQAGGVSSSDTSL
ncbi:hypothetical protein V6N13_060531 [Hibiscus sabdariffa]|uniref:Uncharacterized protein n=1 Tax=Hibiscus sabdariffa TaxID=183260 RepID=A0ABR2P7X0_9ROSI